MDPTTPSSSAPASDQPSPAASPARTTRSTGPATASSTDASAAPPAGSPPAGLGTFGTAGLLLSRCNKLLLPLPLVVWTVVARIDLAGGIPVHLTYRDALEVVALWILGPALLLALVNAVRDRSGPRVWVAALLATFFSRELHFAGTSLGVYVGLLVLIVVLVRQSGRWRATLSLRRFATPLVMVFVCYFFSQTMDQRWWQFIPTEGTWHTPVEETLEVTGHCFSLLLAWCAPGGRAASEPTP